MSLTGFEKQPENIDIESRLARMKENNIVDIRQEALSCFNRLGCNLMPVLQTTVWNEYSRLVSIYCESNTSTSVVFMLYHSERLFNQALLTIQERPLPTIPATDLTLVNDDSRDNIADQLEAERVEAFRNALIADRKKSDETARQKSADFARKEKNAAQRKTKSIAKWFNQSVTIRK